MKKLVEVRGADMEFDAEAGVLTVQRKMGMAELVPRDEVLRQEAIKAARRLRARTWNQANRETYNARQKERMARLRAEKMAAKKP